MRTAVLLFGLFPSDEVKKERIDVKETLSVKAAITAIKVLEAGEGVSYGHTYITDKRTQIAILPIGYADIAIKNLENTGSVLVNGKDAPIVGSICMDHMMIDVTGLAVKVGDVATLLGSSGNRVLRAEEIAKQLGMPSFVFLCSVNKRLPRKYIKHGKVVTVEDVNIFLSANPGKFY